MKIFKFWKPIIWLAIICYGLFVPASELPTQAFLKIPHIDKLVHFFLFFGLCVLLFRPFKKLKLKYYFLAPATSIFLGLFLEASQQLISATRSSDFYDFLANLAGIASALLFYFLFVSNKKWEMFF